MNILKFIESFTNEGIIQSLDVKTSRRDSFSQFGKLGTGAALAAVPFISLFTTNKAKAATTMFSPETETAALSLALILEYLEDEFYATALDSAGLIPNSDKAIIQQISQHEAAHVAFLQTALADAAPAKPEFNFNIAGLDPFNDYPTFLALSQAFEDTGVRAYKGQAGNLQSNGDLLTAALQIHSVEARHASQIRRLRGLKGWIVGNQRGAGMPEATQPVYNGEENTTHGGVNITMFTASSGNPAFGAGSYTESFDEILTGDEATAIASLFFAQ
ncbi:ferritin-like domain-containing protein [Flavobacterium sp. RHBU_24]|uniref:ferritin-like domain-containing protein n=1 Tax=Flavobacterium sp. RHBU_24 TaxID=3391185 RepID=UPI003984E9CF